MAKCPICNHDHRERERPKKAKDIEKRFINNAVHITLCVIALFIYVVVGVLMENDLKTYFCVLALIWANNLSQSVKYGN
tara:strand:+ start:40374 stop:40610 length:237 start_codon:yes stop_codon:yes gene_type:complete